MHQIKGIIKSLLFKQTCLSVLFIHVDCVRAVLGLHARKSGAGLPVTADRFHFGSACVRGSSLVLRLISDD